MKENVFEVIMYLFENFAENSSKLYTDQASITAKLRQAGFLNSEIHKAFEWLESLVSLKEKTLPHATPDKLSIRIFNQQEQKKLSTECRGYLLLLEQIDIINEVTRELVIDRCMALEIDEFGLDHLKWVVLLVLFNQPEQKDRDSSSWMKNIWMEEIIQEPLPQYLH
jgi:Smg protein